MTEQERAWASATTHQCASQTQGKVAGREGAAALAGMKPLRFIRVCGVGSIERALSTPGN